MKHGVAGVQEHVSVGGGSRSAEFSISAETMEKCSGGGGGHLKKRRLRKTGHNKKVCSVCKRAAGKISTVEKM